MPEVLPVTEARRELADVIDRARERHEPVYLSRHGRRVAAVIDADDLERLIELAEDASDVAAAAAARRDVIETGAEPIPWETVKADLGLT